MRSFFLFALTFCSAAASMATPLTMVCASGGNMRATYRQEGSGRGKADFGEITLTFDKARKASNEALPSNGQCAFTHRPLSSSESASAVLLAKTGGVTSITASKGGLQARFADADLNKLIEYTRIPGKRFSVVVDPVNGRLLIQALH